VSAIFSLVPDKLFKSIFNVDVVCCDCNRDFIFVEVVPLLVVFEIPN